MTNSVDPDQTPRFLRRLIWVYTVCKGLSVPILKVITVVNVYNHNLYKCLSEVVERSNGLRKYQKL